jgi:hypothetical protein
MRASFNTTISLIILLAILAMGSAPSLSAPVAEQGPPPCCAHDQADADTAPACPTADCPHCVVPSLELVEPLCCRAVLTVGLNRFPFSSDNPPEIFPAPLEYPPKS